ncbi:tyrosine-type recombinase/integrase [Methylicorpusculum sp.]|uniref:tyrosine-type recombinase/integrase n=1 Tax=Methylicorpusculum sp. TaxID=2713644 RepID=UPI00272F35D6|nr:integrase arm-type DNA-binding domain-containing protein [Methylicorpusculum sp.]MDP2180352.1 tyrosine-type recombinase/integrase [Methylicorpusculum sp.]MDP3528625.1 tyrosine-type recombinase/integrase [Methylicorpusculum sp.]MDZ4153741.1 tyrosine-type recombinase/integrase [Methylicorpusculum sp.]
MLTDGEIRKVKPKENPYKLSDSGGLFLYVAVTGSKLWRLNYRFNGKQKTLSLGSYPLISLSEARTKAAEAKKQIINGIDPSAAKKALIASNIAAQVNSFEVLAREWHETHMKSKSESHSKKVLRFLELDVFPWLGKMAITHIEAPDILSVLRRIESRGANDIAHRTKQIIGQVFRYAIATGRATKNPAPDLQGALKPVTVTHYAAITEPEKIGQLLRAVEGYKGGYITKCALKLSFLVMLRPGEIRNAEWKEIDLERKEWRIPAEKMKMKSEHIVPLSNQSLTIFKEIQNLTGSGRYVFPGARTKDRPMSENTISGALKRLDFSGEEMTAHGFRAMASTRLNEAHLFHPDAIERQLAHGEKDSVRAAYHRAQYLPERIKMLQWWADYLDTLKNNQNVVPFQIKKA